MTAASDQSTSASNSDSDSDSDSDGAANAAEAESASPLWASDEESLHASLGSTPAGLTSEAAASILDRVGPNRLNTRTEDSAWRLLGRQFISPIELILIAATVLSGALGDWTDAAIILVILLLSGMLGFFQERNAGRAMSALLATVEISAVIKRDGKNTDVPVSEVVPGDVAVVSAGDLIPGDCRVLSSNALTVDESALTGETFPAEKLPGTVAAETPITGRSNAVFLGTHVSSGMGTLLVVRTGAHTEIAAIADRLATRPPQNGFERGMTSFGVLLTRLMVVLVVVIFAINLILQRPIIDSALFSLALAVGLTPQLLPAIVSISLSQGAKMMARTRVIVRRLDAIEDFGSMTVLCSDKTGTMTAGEIELDSAVALDGTPSARVAELASLNAGLQLGWKNPIDAAIIAANSVSASAVALDEIPYDFHRKRLSVLVRRSPGEEAVLISKGALDPILAVCSHAAGAEGTVPLADVLESVHQRFAELSAQGFRVLGLATRHLSGQEKVSTDDETGMTLVGLLTFADPVKADAASTLADLNASGVSVRMVTGDNRLVAAHVAQQVGLDVGTVFTGSDIDARDDAALAIAVQSVQVFSELNPVQKERIVHAFRTAGEVVGYLGDGINDSPPLHAADVGISVDTAVPVAKQSAAIVLLDKDLRVILDGVLQGRRTFANTMKYIFMTTSANFGNMLSMAIAALVLPFLPLLAGQILLINLLTDLPATFIATDSVDKAQLRRPQRWNVKLIRDYMFVFGALSSVFDLATFAILRWGFDAEAPEFRSAWFLASILTEVGVLFVLRTRGRFYRSKPSRWLVISSIVVVIVAVAIPYSPAASLLQLVPIPLELLALVLLVTLTYVIATELVKRIFWRR
ncbi:magnesium-translocating P-type ATPase [Salinibacterium sp. SWN1162]|uniref:magnesium-translocating P-type ATPase n=1 Tax=Salinibacterium sp. SWN1162 TaxID=2792053 RepID=UPI0018CD5AE1|nr:magnesium-translocating P-type ATPase [Salinibacterium sp. SWN1162]MBH0008275.1 magnesium-translocating P-type ATPase [Salinibacterium sp. SWN1162]